MLRVLLPLVLLTALLWLPGVWAHRVMAHYERVPSRGPSGGEMARRLLDESGLQAVRVEPTEQGDHYDPQAKTVRLTPRYLEGRTLTARVVAAHEVGHAIQDQIGYRPLRLRQRLVAWSQGASKLGGILAVASPVAMLLTRMPSAGALMLVAAVVGFGLSAVAQMAALPVEWDASFRRALPLLRQLGLLTAEDEPAARRVLRAAALTYVANAGAVALNLWRWLRLLR